MSQTIAILNGKGGVGKTTTAINLGTALWLMGKRVLLVDADPQSNLTLAVDQTACGQGFTTLYEWLTDEENPLDEPPIYTKYDGLDYVPASPQMESVNQWLVNQTKREEYLNDRLKQVTQYYDYVIIDCAPAIDSLLNTNVLVASDGIIIPTRTDFFGVQSQGAMQKKIETMRKKFKKELPIYGYLLTQWERTKADTEIKNYFVAEESVKLFRTPIRKCSACRAILPRQMSLYEYDAYSTAADDYMMLAEDIVGRKVRPKNFTPDVWKKQAVHAYNEFIHIQQEG